MLQPDALDDWLYPDNSMPEEMAESLDKKKRVQFTHAGNRKRRSPHHGKYRDGNFARFIFLVNVWLCLGAAHAVHRRHQFRRS